MNKKRRNICFILVLVVVLAFSLVSCDQPDSVDTINYATFYYQNDGILEPTTQRIYTDDFRVDATLADVFKLADYKYDFGAIIREEETSDKKDIFLDALVNKGLVPNALQEISVYSDDETAKENSDSQSTEIFGINVYKTNSLNKVTLKNGKKYIFKVSADYKEPAFEENLGDPDKTFTSITEPVIYKDYLYLIRDNHLIKINKEGVELAKVSLAANCYYGGMIPPIIVENYIVCGLISGQVQAFNLETLEEKWIYTPKTSNSSVASPMVYDKETKTIYVGLYVQENSNVKEAPLVAIDAETGNVKSKTTSKYGYYFVSPIIIKDVLISGKVEQDDKTYLVAYDKKDLSVEKDRLEVKGLVKSSFAYMPSEKGLFFITFDNGNSFINRIWFDEVTNLFGKNIILEKTACTYSHGTPGIYKDRLYVTSADNSTFNPTNGYIQVIDIKSMKEIYKVKTGALNSSNLYIKPVVHNKQEEIFVFFTLNKNGTGIQYIVDKANSVSGVMYTTHIPTKANNSMSNILVDEDGSMYYKNDSNILTKIEKGYFAEND